MSYSRKPSVPPPIVSGSPPIAEKFLHSRWSDQSMACEPSDKRKRSVSNKAASNLSLRSLASKSNADVKKECPGPIVNISHSQNNGAENTDPGQLADELDYITIDPPTGPLAAVNNATNALAHVPRADKASRVLGINHRRSMEPIPASTRNSLMSTRSARDAPPTPTHVPTLPLTSLYVVSGLPKSPHTWTLADSDSILGLHHSDSAVNRWWRPEVLGSTVSPGAGGGQKKKKKNGKHEEIMKGAGALTKPEVGKMLSKALKVYMPVFRVACRFLNELYSSYLSLAKSRLLPQLFNLLQQFIHSHSIFPLPTRHLLPNPRPISFARLSSQAPMSGLPMVPLLTLTTTILIPDPIHPLSSWVSHLMSAMAAPQELPVAIQRVTTMEWVLEVGMLRTTAFVLPFGPTPTLNEALLFKGRWKLHVRAKNLPNLFSRRVLRACVAKQVASLELGLKMVIRLHKPRGARKRTREGHGLISKLTAKLKLKLG